MRAPRLRCVTAGLLAWAAAACAGARARTESAPAPGAPAAAEIETIYRARMDSARMRFGDADVRFVTGMIHHHAQALLMADLVPGRGASPPLQTLASRIINAQQDEIALMQGWLRDREQPVPEVGREGSEHALHMPGMLTAEQMQELERAQGAELDRLFLTYMIQHHRGAVTMVRDLFGTPGAAQDEAVFKLASDIQVDQATEIARMELMLAALPAR